MSAVPCEYWVFSWTSWGGNSVCYSQGRRHHGPGTCISLLCFIMLEIDSRCKLTFFFACLFCSGQHIYSVMDVLTLPGKLKFQLTSLVLYYIQKPKAAAFCKLSKRERRKKEGEFYSLSSNFHFSLFLKHFSFNSLM